MFFTTEAHRTMTDLVWRCTEVIIGCEACKRQSRWPSDALKAKFRPEITLGEVATRLKCACGSREGQIYTRQDQDATRNRDTARFNTETEAKDSRRAAYTAKPPSR